MMMMREDVKRRLEVAISYQDHDAFAAAAKIGWPDALLDLQDVLGELDDANAVLLRQTRQLVKGDDMARAIRGYIDRLVREGPYKTDKEFIELLRAHQEYEEARGK